MPSGLRAQVWKIPVLSCVNVPVGGIAWPPQVAPQQATLPSALSPQVCGPPALTCANSPTGGRLAFRVVMTTSEWAAAAA